MNEHDTIFVLTYSDGQELNEEEFSVYLDCLLKTSNVLSIKKYNSSAFYLCFLFSKHGECIDYLNDYLVIELSSMPPCPSTIIKKENSLFCKNSIDVAEFTEKRKPFFSVASCTLIVPIRKKLG